MCVKHTHNNTFRESNIYYRIRFKNLPNNQQQLQVILYACIDKLINLSLVEKGSSMIRLAIYHDGLETPIGFPYMKRDDISIEMIMARFLLVSQSNKD